MGFIKDIAGTLGSALFGGIGLVAGKSLVRAVVGGKKKKKDPVVQPSAREFSRDDGQDAADALRRRRGRSADMVTGAGGAEPASGTIGRLVVGS